MTFSTARIELPKNKMLRIMGPANVCVEQGKVRILGIEFGERSRFIIHRFRSYVIRAVEPSIISVVLGTGGVIEEPGEGEEVIDVWESIAEKIVSTGNFVAMVVGPVDSGKTSFSTLLANVSLDKGLRVGIVDADVGQGDLAPPGFVAAKILDRKVLWLRELRGDRAKFVGFITPSIPQAGSRLLTAISQLVEELRSDGCRAIVVNTDGWVHGLQAIEMKLDIALAIGATHVVVLDEDVCTRFKESLGGRVEVVCAPRPKVVRERNRVDRRMLRRHHYMSFFHNAKKRCVDLSNIIVVGSCLLSGKPVEVQVPYTRARIYRVVDHDDCIVVYASTDLPPDVLAKLRESLGKEVVVVTPSSVKGLLAAVLDRNLKVVAPALIESLDLSSNKICMLTEYEGEVGGIVVGRIKLSENWDEITKLPRCPI